MAPHGELVAVTARHHGQAPGLGPGVHLRRDYDNRRVQVPGGVLGPLVQLLRLQVRAQVRLLQRVLQQGVQGAQGEDPLHLLGAAAALRAAPVGHRLGLGSLRAGALVALCLRRRARERERLLLHVLAHGESHRQWLLHADSRQRKLLRLGQLNLRERRSRSLLTSLCCLSLLFSRTLLQQRLGTLLQEQRPAALQNLQLRAFLKARVFGLSRLLRADLSRHRRRGRLLLLVALAGQLRVLGLELRHQNRPGLRLWRHLFFRLRWGLLLAGWWFAPANLCRNRRRRGCRGLT
mmetsp:Transcript_77631/g.186220  ORF Transcript_77631/g.186220 Transcript_77631/m.186220 type:complete len:292 (+) Transcript_77631:1787-2662(+)